MMKISSMQLAAVAIGFGAMLSGCTTPKPVSSKLAPLAETVTSFGAATCDGWLYAFGGHKGERHDYNIEMVSGSFERLNLSNGNAWESLPPATPGQGQPLVAYN